MLIKNKYLSISLASLFLISACNEKVAPALSDPSGATSDSTSSTALKSFKVTEKSVDMFGYVLHKTGSLSADCEVRDEKGNFVAPDEDQEIDPAHDITCFLEAEESFLYWNGIEFQLDVDPGICEKVAYTPYSFYHWQPGASHGLVNFATCDTYASAGMFGGIDAGYACDTYIDSVTAGNTQIESNLCVFDHSDEEYGDTTGPNCDVGTVNIRTKECGGVDTNDDGTVDDVVCGTSVITQKKCGGKIGNCVSGPVTEVRDASQTRITTFYDSEILENGFSHSIKHTDPFSLGLGTNMYLANFTRQCSGIADSTADLGATTWPHAQDDFDVDTNFDPAKMMVYSRSAITQDDPVDNNLYNSVNMTTTIYADDPFKGSLPISPYYEFACLDGAQEIKARIRIVVRDWDRAFSSTNTGIAQVSDWWKNDNTGILAPDDDNYASPNGLAYMDTGLRFYEIDVDHYQHSEYFNDFLDWDDWFNADDDDNVSNTRVGYNPFDTDTDGGGEVECVGALDQGDAPLTGPKADRNFPKWAL